MADSQARLSNGGTGDRDLVPSPFSTSDDADADAQVWALMMVLTLGLMFLPLVPGLRDIPRLVPVHRLVWRDYHRDHPPRRG